MDSLKLLFAGTPQFSVPALARLCQSQHSIEAVLTQPDRPAGRGRKLHVGPIKQFALANELTVLQPASLKAEAIQTQLAAFKADVMVVVAYGLILPEAVLSLPKFGCLNIHASLLPRWRGAAPIHRAILAGDEQTGVTIMQMDKGLDTGDILSSQVSPISAHTRTIDLYDQLAEMGADLLLGTLTSLTQGLLKPIHQEESRACYANKLDKTEAVINWQQSARQIDRQVRAFNPWPVAQTVYQAKTLKVWATEVVDGLVADNTVPGLILQADKQGIVVQTGRDCLKITELQLAGGKRMDAAAFLNAHKMLDKILGEEITDYE